MGKPGSLIVVLLCAGLVGCGSTRAKEPEISSTPAAPTSFETFTLTGGDVSFPYPADWHLERRQPPGVATAATGGASFTVWAYRSQVLVADPASQARALKDLITSLKGRDPGFQLQSVTQQQRFGTPAFEIIGMTTINGHRVKVRSDHIYRGRGEYVVDQIADPAQFSRVNTEVFEPLLAGIRLLGDPPAPQGG
ncbi:MAG: hypothetical protein ABR536_04220 [Solirubrobacterales bacterium]